MPERDKNTDITDRYKRGHREDELCRPFKRPRRKRPIDTATRFCRWTPSGTVISSLDKTLPIPGFELHPSNGFARMLIALLSGDAMSPTPIAEGLESKSLGDSGEVVGILCFEALFSGIVQEQLSPDS